MRLALLAVALTGCMRIYPDGEMPDLHVYWTESDCRPETPSVRVAVSLRDDTPVAEQTVPCEALQMTFKDVKPARYQVDSSLLLPDGEAFSAWRNELDMRDGFDAEEYVYFGGGGYLRIGFELADGATCTSIGADLVLLEFEDDLGNPTTTSTACELSPWVGSPFGASSTYTVQLRAVDYETITTRAISPVVGPFTVMPPMLTNLGTITLTPCTDC